MTQLEEWCRTNQLHDKNVVQQLEPITEVVQLLQVNKKSLEDVDGIIAIVKHLNALQVGYFIFKNFFFLSSYLHLNLCLSFWKNIV